MQVHRVEGKIMAVNAYVVEAESGVVVVDGMLTMSDARAVRAEIDRIGKPLLGAIVTHAHPDHYAGFAEILGGRAVPIVSTRAVREAITRDDAEKDRIVGPMMGPEWPRERVFPSRDVNSGEPVRFEDLVFEVEDLGPGESPADSLWRLGDRVLFVGDLVYSGMHAYLADGHATEWLALLERLERELVSEATLYVGHGRPGGKELLTAQVRYIHTFAGSVERHLAKPEDERRAAVIADMKALLPTEDLGFLMELSVDPFAAKLALVDPVTAGSTPRR